MRGGKNDCGCDERRAAPLVAAPPFSASNLLQNNAEVLGQQKQGLVTVEAVKKFGSLHFNLITVDPIEENGSVDVNSPILVAGNEDRLCGYFFPFCSCSWNFPGFAMLAGSLSLPPPLLLHAQTSASSSTRWSFLERTCTTVECFLRVNDDDDGDANDDDDDDDERRRRR